MKCLFHFQYFKHVSLASSVADDGLKLFFPMAKKFISANFTWQKYNFYESPQTKPHFFSQYSLILHFYIYLTLSSMRPLTPFPKMTTFAPLLRFSFRAAPFSQPLAGIKAMQSTFIRHKGMKWVY